MSSESTNSDEKKDNLPEIKSVEEIRREKAKSKQQIQIETQKKTKNSRLQAELNEITEQAKKITLDGSWLKPQPWCDNKRTRSAFTTARREAFATAAVPNKIRRVKNADVAKTSTNLKIKGKAKNDIDLEDLAKTSTGRSYDLRSRGNKGLMDVDVDSVISNVNRTGKGAKTDVDVEDMETDIEEGCKTMKKTKKDDDDDMDRDGFGSGAATERRVTRSSSRMVDPV